MNCNADVKALLEKVHEFSMEQDETDKRTGRSFNVFAITGIATKEVAICRLMHDLLSPKGTHSQGDAYLRLFNEHILRLKFEEEDYSKASVKREYGTRDGRKIDLVIKTPNYVIPIEVKIHAEDQNSQCIDYYRSAVNSRVFYLTKYGSAPGNHSISEEDAEKYVTLISFSKDIIKWLEECIKHHGDQQVPSIRETLTQLIQTIKGFTYQVEDDLEMKIAEEMISSSERMRSAVKIAQSLEAAKLKLMKTLFDQIESKVEAERIADNPLDYRYKGYKAVNEYFQSSKVNQSLPGISYRFIDNVKPGIDLWVRIEVDHRLYIGYYPVYKEGCSDASLSKEEIREVLGIIEPEMHKDWAHWEYISLDKESPNFKHHNDELMELADESKMDELSSLCAEKVRRFLNREIKG